jgi:AraC-like DNA-binding protein
MYVLGMVEGHRLLITDAPVTRLGQITLAGQVLDAKPLMPTTLRVLDDVVISLVTAGRGHYRHADGRVQDIVAPCLTVVAAGVPHTYGTAEGEAWTEWFVVGRGALWDLWTATGLLPAEDGPCRLSPGAHPDDLAALLGEPPRSRAAAEHQLWSLSAWLTTARRQEDAGVWDRAEQLLAADLGRPLDLPRVAADLGLSYDAFRRGFAAHAGRPPLAYRNVRRLEVAARWLQLTTMTHSEIARRLGYTDEFHLSRRFRAHFGVPPQTYRRTRQHT